MKLLLLLKLLGLCLHSQVKKFHLQRVINLYTATVSDAFAGIKRLQLANEGSAKENIYKLLKEFQTSY